MTTFPDDRETPRLELTARYLSALGAEAETTGLTPSALSRAVVRILPVDAAGVTTLVTVLRVPLGASNDAARTAEELQTSLGLGPCLSAAETKAALAADLDEIAARWPLYSAELVRRTPFRSVASVPLSSPGWGVFAALDLYGEDSRLSPALDLAQVEHLAAPLAALLTTCIAQVHHDEAPDELPAWYRSAAGRRNDVWVAIGMVMAVRGGHNRDALSLLRAHAYGQDSGLDDVAADVVHGRLPVTELTG